MGLVFATFRFSFSGHFECTKTGSGFLLMLLVKRLLLVMAIHLHDAFKPCAVCLCLFN